MKWSTDFFVEFILSLENMTSKIGANASTNPRFINFRTILPLTEFRNGEEEEEKEDETFAELSINMTQFICIHRMLQLKQNS